MLREHPPTTESYPQPPPSAMRVLRSLSAPSLGRLASCLVPAAAVDDAGRPTLMLLHGIGVVLAEREQRAA
jgi:hypothetical protein